jgi:hypothetical protein
MLPRGHCTPVPTRHRVPGPSPEIDAGVRYVVSVNSRNAEATTTSSPQSYSVRLQAPFVRVRRVQLLSTEFPNTRFLVDATNRMIDVNFETVPSTFTTQALQLEQGYYNVTDLQAELDVRLNALLGLGPGVVFAVTFDPTTGRYTVARVDGLRFRFLFGTGTNATRAPTELFGFAPRTDTTLQTALTAPYAANCNGDDYSILCIAGLGCLQGTEPEIPPQDAFAKLIWPVPSRTQTFNTFHAGDCTFAQQPAFLGRLETLRVWVLRPNGQPYDFQGVHHSFTLEITADPN